MIFGIIGVRVKINYQFQLNFTLIRLAILYILVDWGWIKIFVLCPGVRTNVGANLVFALRQKTGNAPMSETNIYQK